MVPGHSSTWRQGKGWLESYLEVILIIFVQGAYNAMCYLNLFVCCFFSWILFCTLQWSSFSTKSLFPVYSYKTPNSLFMKARYGCLPWIPSFHGPVPALLVSCFMQYCITLPSLKRTQPTCLAANVLFFLLLCCRQYPVNLNHATPVLYHWESTALSWHPWWQGSWGQHGAHLGPTGPRWTPCWEREIKFIGLLGNRGHWGPYSPYKPYNHDLYIGIIIFPHIDNPQSTGYN